MLACGLVLLLGVALAIRWRSYSFVLPDRAARDPRMVDRVGLQLLWLLSVGMLAGFAVGALVIGPGGRLAMRLLAATSPESRGFQTEAQETVGRITVGGTFAFIFFVGLAFGVGVGLTYVFVSWALPRGIAGGAIFGAALLVVFGTHIDPLRGSNRDFTIVGPGWLAVVTFTTLAVLTGAVLAPTTGRIAAVLPAPRVRWAWWLVPTGLFTCAALTSAPVAWVVPAVGSVVFLAVRTSPALRERVGRRGKTVLGVALTGVVLVSLPTFISSVDDIANLP